jgi:hypothetical protein
MLRFTSGSGDENDYDSFIATDVEPENEGVTLLILCDGTYHQFVLDKELCEKFIAELTFRHKQLWGGE